MEGKDNIYALETNFYTSGGSKLNETSRSYKLLAEKARNISGFVFVWITDGEGWKNAKHNLEDAFMTIRYMYNIADLENRVLASLFNR